MHRFAAFFVVVCTTSLCVYGQTLSPAFASSDSNGSFLYSITGNDRFDFKLAVKVDTADLTTNVVEIPYQSSWGQPYFMVPNPVTEEVYVRTYIDQSVNKFLVFSSVDLSLKLEVELEPEHVPVAVYVDPNSGVVFAVKHGQGAKETHNWGRLVIDIDGGSVTFEEERPLLEAAWKAFKDDQAHDIVKGIHYFSAESRRTGKHAMIGVDVGSGQVVSEIPYDSITSKRPFEYIVFDQTSGRIWGLVTDSYFSGEGWRICSMDPVTGDFRIHVSGEGGDDARGVASDPVEGFVYVSLGSEAGAITHKFDSATGDLVQTIETELAFMQSSF